jgi:1-acyl-sn-glycerol-3-phosphate acyltransferase
LRATGFLALVVALVPVYLLSAPLGRHIRRAVAALFLRGCRALTGLSIRRFGYPVSREPVLYVANHSSYLDIVALGSLLDATFVAKREVAAWPLFGWLAQIGRTVFISRSPYQVDAERDLLVARLSAGENLLLFPEGTTSDGTRLLPFKSALLSSVGEGGGTPWVQPISVAYTRLADGRPITSALSALYAWFGDAELVGHLWSVFGLEGAEMDVIFHPLVDARTFPSRKALARHCETEIARGLSWSRAAALDSDPLEHPVFSPGPSLAAPEEAFSPAGS